MPHIRRATAVDAAIITAQRHSMFADNDLAYDAAYQAMNANFESWVRERLADGRYVGFFLEERPAANEPSEILAAAGVFYQDFPPHFLDPAPLRAYLLNFYTAPEARGRGYARQLLAACVEEARSRNVGVITLHASKFGKPIYEKFGFRLNNEMILKPGKPA